MLRTGRVGAVASMTRWLADAVGPTGRVTATDIDLRFLLERGATLVSVGLLRQEDMDRALFATSDPTVSWFTAGLVTAWGRKP